MTTVLIYHRVADYDTWRLAYDRIAAGPLGSDTRSFRIWRGQDDPNLVVIEEMYDSRDVPRLHSTILSCLPRSQTLAWRCRRSGSTTWTKSLPARTDAGHSKPITVSG